MLNKVKGGEGQKKNVNFSKPYLAHDALIISPLPRFAVSLHEVLHGFPSFLYSKLPFLKLSKQSKLIVITMVIPNIVNYHTLGITNP